jgi:hypothetical protein
MNISDIKTTDAKILTRKAAKNINVFTVEAQRIMIVCRSGFSREL